MAINLGTVKPGSTIFIPFNTFDSNDPSASVAIAAFVVGDIEVYKDGVATTRASTNGYTLLDTDGIDFDSHVGIGGISISLADNSTAGFYAAGSKYFVMIGPVTVDAAVVNFIAATFDIGYSDAILNTTIASLTSATQFILTDGPAEADVFIGSRVILHDVASKVQVAFGIVSDYIVTTKEVFLVATPVGFTPVATDNISLFMPNDVHSVRGTVQTAGDLAALIVTADAVVDAIKLETDKLTLGDAGAGSAGSIIEEIENRPTTAMRGTDNVVLSGPTKAEMDTAHGLLATEAKQDIIDTNVDDIKSATIMASGVVEASGSNSSTQVQTDLSEATNDHYDVMTIAFISGAEAGQSRLITGYVGSTGVVSWNAPLTGTPANGVSFVILAAGTTADAVWDEILTGASHNISTSAGRRLRQLEQSFVQASGVIATVTNGHTFTLDAGAVATADYYPHSRLTITEGTGAGQSRLIINYTAGRVVTVESDFTINPDTASLYEIEAADANVPSSAEHMVLGYVVTATNTTTITLDSFAVATENYYRGLMIFFHDGTGAGQSALITGYTSGRVVTMSPALTTAVAAGTTYRISAVPSILEAVDQGWDEAKSGHVVSGSFGEEVQAHALETTVAALNDVSTAEVNLEVLDVMNVDTFAEPPQGSPAATASIFSKINHLYKTFRNKKEQTSTEFRVFNDLGTVVDAKAAVSDVAGVTTKDEMVGGP